MYVKVITPEGKVTHLNWKDNYNALRKKLGVEYPGYVDYFPF